MPVTLLGSASVLDRQSGRRSDAAYLARLAAAPEARFLLLAASTPLIRPSPLDLWFSGADLAQAHVHATGGAFLGVTPGTAYGHFACALSADETSRLAKQHKLELTGDFRAIASAGLLPASGIAPGQSGEAIFTRHGRAGPSIARIGTRRPPRYASRFRYTRLNNRIWMAGRCAAPLRGDSRRLRAAAAMTGIRARETLFARLPWASHLLD